MLPPADSTDCTLQNPGGTRGGTGDTSLNRRWDWRFTLVGGLVMELEGLMMLGLVKIGGGTG